ncbi:MAG: UvrD-helicase domain-containing protein [Myxococcota bacterium]
MTLPSPSLRAVAEEDSEVALPEGLRLEQNLAILAGAGAGKTYSLVTMCLHLLGGARTGFEPISCAELGLLTFTEKAADEMRSRLRERLDRLATGAADEPVLRDSFEAAGVPFPSPRRWRAIRDELGGATIGTFHSLCTQLLRRAPPNSGVSPHFELLEERDARMLLRDLVERHVLARVERGSPLRTLVAELSFGRLIEALVPIATRIREEGVAPDYVKVADGPTLRAQFETRLASLRARALALQPKTAHQREQLEAFRRAVTRATFETFEADYAALSSATYRAHAPVSELKELTEQLSQLYAAVILAPFEAEVRELLVEVSTAHEEALVTRGVLDFTGLLVQARNLLRDSPEARRDAQARFKALLVDEFQDTNRLQLEIVLLLSEKRSGAPRPVSQAFEQQHREIVRMPQEPGFLAVVGDRKQSIYEFRGADVSVFEVMAKAIEASGGGRAYLRHSRRSTAPLLEVLNRGFTVAMGPAAVASPALDFEVVYRPEHDDLRAVRDDAPSGLPLVQLVDARVPPERPTAEALRAADAEAVARAIAWGLAGNWMVSGKDGERVARGGDVAVLFQRFTQLETYRQALVRCGVRHRVVRGRGFYGAQEVVDLACLLAILADPEDALALSAVLRSPLVGLPDAEWISLARPGPGATRWGLDARAVLLGEASAGSAAVDEFRARYRVLRSERDRLGLRALLRVALDTFEYRVAVAAAPFGEQALANLDKLLVLATAREKQGVGVAAFARELLELADDAPKEAQGEVVDELDLDAVTLCTVHQAKGLEWPIVVLPDLATAPRGETAAVRFDRLHGLGIVRPKGVTELRSHSAVNITGALTRRARAEHLRLLYVAMTRARDRVVLGLRHPSAQANTWARDAESFFALSVTGERPEQLEVSTLPLLKPPAAPRSASTADVDALVRRVRTPLRAASRALVLPVSQLQDHASCPRRYHLAHQVGLLERSRLGGELDGEELSTEDVRARGVAVHRLLELTPLSALASPSLPALLRELRRSQGLERLVGDDVLVWIERFWRTDFARALTPETVLRELPFVLRLEHEAGPALVLRGQIDLLVVLQNELLVIDYKTSTMPPAGLEPYRFQLACYALAARRFVNDSRRPVRAGVVFLQEQSPEPVFFPSLELASFSASLVAEAQALELAQRTGAWSGRPRNICESLGCGYLSRCHP